MQQYAESNVAFLNVFFFVLFSGISNEEKMHLRQKLLMYLREANDQVFLFFFLLVAVLYVLWARNAY